MAHLYVKTPNGTQYGIALGVDSIVANGYALLGNGLRIQWGKESGVPSTETTHVLTFNTDFTSKCFSFVNTIDISEFTDAKKPYANVWLQIVAITKSNATLYSQWSQLTDSVIIYSYWIALGN